MALHLPSVLLVDTFLYLLQTEKKGGEEKREREKEREKKRERETGRLREEE